MSMTSANPDPTTPKSSATRPLVAPRDIRAIARDLGYSPDWNWSWENYKNTIVALTNEYDLRDHLEIGGGRDPVFQPPELVRPWDQGDDQRHLAEGARSRSSRILETLLRHRLTFHPRHHRPETGSTSPIARW